MALVGFGNLGLRALPLPAASAGRASGSRPSSTTTRPRSGARSTASRSRRCAELPREVKAPRDPDRRSWRCPPRPPRPSPTSWWPPASRRCSTSPRARVKVPQGRPAQERRPLDRAGDPVLPPGAGAAVSRRRRWRRSPRRARPPGRLGSLAQARDGPRAGAPASVRARRPRGLRAAALAARRAPPPSRPGRRRRRGRADGAARPRRSPGLRGALGRKPPCEFSRAGTAAALWRGGRRTRGGRRARAAFCGRLLRGRARWWWSRRRPRLESPLPPPADFRRQVLTLGAGDRLDRELLLEAPRDGRLRARGDRVGVGQWALRGGIVDVFSPAGIATRCAWSSSGTTSSRSGPSIPPPSAPRGRSRAPRPPDAGSGRRDAPARLLTTCRPTAPLAVADPALLAPRRARRSGRWRHSARRPRVECERAPDRRARKRTGAEHALDPRRCRATASSAARARRSGLAGRGLPGAARRSPTRTRPRDRLQEILREHRARGARSSPPARPRAGSPCHRRRRVLGGFAIPRARPRRAHRDRDLRARRRALRRPKYQRGAALTAFTDLAANDLVVHEDHGIGRYLGPRTMAVGRRERRLPAPRVLRGRRSSTCPVERLDLVSKYLGGDDRGRRGSTGSAAPLAAREGVGAGGPARDGRGAAQALRAARGGSRATRSRRDTPWQREFEAAFPFEETPDQLRAIDEVKRDMRAAPADGPAGLRRRRLRQDRGRAARRLQGRRSTGTRSPCSCRRPCSPSSTGTPSATASRPFPVAGRDALALPLAQASRRRCSRGLRRGHGRRRDRHPPAPLQGRRASRTSGSWSSTRSTASASRTRSGMKQLRAVGRRADADRDPDPAHALHVARRASATCR